ncbi:hypothetical protein GAN17_07540 [Mycobacterium kubicae]|uniref:hypothetical protein n=1 Tax=Mycobacterium kubicae TaxID=120959 RepID=UPI00163E8624|nr:hypothetical protein [Mycobacterium kubicae]QNI06155.1 hypothetical protein GAN17_07540 [Mycobacterium kubicae]
MSNFVVARQARWWFVAAAILLAGSLVALYVGAWRVDAWVHQLESNHCATPWPPAPNLTAPGWATVGLVIPTMICLAAASVLVLIGKRRWWLKVTAILGVLGVLLVSLFILLIGYSDATSGVDRYTVSGSDGGPLCPASG